MTAAVKIPATLCQLLNVTVDIPPDNALEDVIVYPIPKFVTNLLVVSLVILLAISLVIVLPRGALTANVVAGLGLSLILSLSSCG